jgi:hypothetical protein
VELPTRPPADLGTLLDAAAAAWAALAGVAGFTRPRAIVDVAVPPRARTQSAAKVLARVLARQILAELKGTS